VQLEAAATLLAKRNKLGTRVGPAYLGGPRASYGKEMHRPFSTRAVSRRYLLSAAALLCCGLPCALAQTGTAAQTAPPSGAAIRQTAPPELKVDYAPGKLSVNARNASLNQILQEIAGKIGMKITGGVREERVFGQYGPSSPSIVLQALLDGTGGNMLLVDHPKGPTELILTPRSGGPTPPSPHPAPEERAEEVPTDQPAQPPVTPAQVIPRRGMGHPPAPGSNPEMNAAPGTSDNPGTPNGDSPASPNGTKTPQQIYNQLRQMQQNQQNPQ
jgi:hypothetical protein